MKTRVAVMYGGRSVEHEVSVISGIQALMNIDTDKYETIPVYITKQNEFYVGDDIGKIEAYKDIDGLLARSQKVVWVNEGDKVVLSPYPKKMFGGMKDIEVDVAFPVVHGTNEEDGTLVGFLKTLGIPFVGCDVTSAAVGMDKYIQKCVLKDVDIPVLDCVCFHEDDYADMEKLLDTAEQKVGYPAVIKPVNSGSSVGISMARNREELTKSIDDAFTYASIVLVEHGIEKLKEINCSVLGDDSGAKASILEEPFHTKDILSYKDKYESNGAKSGGSKGMASVQRKIPADLPEETTKQIQDYAVRAFKALGCNGVVRIDFMIDEATGKLYFNEINTIPGSLSFYLWEPSGVPYKDLLDQLIQLALKRARKYQNITFTFDTNILNSASFGGAKGVK
ncbi:MAG: D-alanine--D-alanine ligase [Lachnospiraceae bacterium]|uniref:D-alanine--D-alanine ligase n=1 Tax=Candidatus Weimeria bifida TaxID=2599074 RepID=A0A6N7J1N8_9FIRM|nr:D-alanine--D-alanine ligase [Candidatus Weimeria bifida]RRF96419.1 MAG: D-alanine--D-alanine ligase [Lachnospiraceae bacterium]